MTIEQKARAWLSGDQDLDVHQLVRDLVARNTELEVACAQAVEFATYVEGAAKGTMVERAKHFMSAPFAQELAARLNPPPAPPSAEPVDILVLQPSGFELAIERGQDGRWYAPNASHQQATPSPPSTIDETWLSRLEEFVGPGATAYLRREFLAATRDAPTTTGQTANPCLGKPELCGCGKPAEYMAITGGWCCNKYGIKCLPVGAAGGANSQVDGTVWNRAHRGSLEDAMRTVEKIPSTVEAVRAYLAKHNGQEVTGVVEVKPYGDDPRIGWTTYIVLVDGHPWGFTNGLVVTHG